MGPVAYEEGPRLMAGPFFFVLEPQYGIEP